MFLLLNMAVDMCLRKVQMFIFEISLRLLCGHPCGAGPYMKEDAGLKCSDAKNFLKYV